MSKLSKLEPHVRITISKPGSTSNSVFGPGIAALCQGVQDHGSLNAAAKAMHMAYSKAWRITKDTEAALGFQLLARDGAHGSTLTKEGLQLLEMYTSLQQKLSQEAVKLYQKGLK